MEVSIVCADSGFRSRTPATLSVRKDKPSFIELTELLTCFFAVPGPHNEMSPLFRDMLERMTAGRRLGMCVRRHIDDFEAWGDEAPDTSSSLQLGGKK